MVPQSLQEPGRGGPQGIVVLRKQDGLRSAHGLPLGLRRDRLGFPGVEREIDAERGSPAGLAVDVDQPGVLLHDSVHHGEPEARAAAHLLRREERLEDPRLRRRVHPHARVAHGQAHEVPRPRPGMRLAEVPVEGDPFGQDGHLTALGHCVPRVGAEVHHDLLERAWIGVHGGGIGGLVEGQPDIFADNALHQLRRARNQRVQVQRPRREDLLAPEREQLSGERRRAVHHLGDLHEIRPHRDLRMQVVRYGDVDRREVEQGEVRGGPDDGEEVVEVVRHAAGQRAHGLHLLRQAELLLQAPLFGDVAGNAVDSNDRTAFVAHRTQRFLDPPLRAVPVPDAVFGGGLPAGGHGLVVGGDDARPVLRMNRGPPPGPGGGRRFRREPEDARAGRRDVVQLLQGRVHAEDHVRHVRQHALQPLLQRSDVPGQLGLGRLELLFPLPQLAVLQDCVLVRGDQHAEDLLFVRGDRERAAEEIERDAELDLGRLAQVPIPEHMLDALQQVVGPVRLGQEVVGSALEPSDDVRGIAQAGEQDDREVRPPQVGLDPPADLVPGDSGHQDVGDDQVERAPGDQRERRFAVRRHRHLPAVVYEHRPQRLGLGATVFNDQDTDGHRSLPARPPPAGRPLR